jgi:hypothetical protein
LAFLLTQAVMLARYAIRCAFLGSLLAVYQRTYPVVVAKPRIIYDGQPPVRRPPADPGFWARNSDLDRDLVGMPTRHGAGEDVDPAEQTLNR